MGTINSVTCCNKTCRYHAELREGSGVIVFARERRLEEKIRNGDIEGVNPKAVEIIRNAPKLPFKVQTVGMYQCDECREFLNIREPYVFDYEEYKEDDSRFIVDGVYYLFQEPACPVCASRVRMIANIRSSKVKCPKCGDELSCVSGYYD